MVAMLNHFETRMGEICSAVLQRVLLVQFALQVKKNANKSFEKKLNCNSFFTDHYCHVGSDVFSTVCCPMQGFYFYFKLTFTMCKLNNLIRKPLSTTSRKWCRSSANSAMALQSIFATVSGTNCMFNKCQLKSV